MTVTIVTPPTPMVPTANIDDASGKLGDSGSALAGQDFASILLGQLVPLEQSTQPTTTVEETPSEEAAVPGDNVAVFAALTLAPQVAAASTAPEVPEGESTQTTTGISKGDASLLQPTERQATSGATTSLKADDTAAVPAAPTELSDTTANEGKPAKFAVPALAESVKESLSPKTVSPEGQPNNIVPVSNNASAHHSPAAHGPTHSLSVPTPLRDQNWASDFGQKIMWLAGNDKQSAQMTLNPPQMGPIDISLNIEKGNATASFVSANADVREAIETAMPRLREMFASAGIALGQTNVSAESFKQQAGHGNENGGQPASWARDNAILGTEATGSILSRAAYTQRGNGMVDLFA